MKLSLLAGELASYATGLRVGLLRGELLLLLRLLLLLLLLLPVECLSGLVAVQKSSMAICSRRKRCRSPMPAYSCCGPMVSCTTCPRSAPSSSDVSASNAHGARTAT